MRGLSSWMRSQVKPMRSSAPGPKFSTSTSQFFTSRSRIAFPFGCLASTVIERLLSLSIVKYRLSTSGTSRSWPRVTSPIAGTLDLDHVGAQPGEQLRAGRTGLDVGEVENAHAVECLADLTVGLG